MYQEIVTSFRSRCRVVSTELFPQVVIVPSAKIQFSSLGAKTYRHTATVQIKNFDSRVQNTKSATSVQIPNLDPNVQI